MLLLLFSFSMILLFVWCRLQQQLSLLFFICYAMCGINVGTTQNKTLCRKIAIGQAYNTTICKNHSEQQLKYHTKSKPIHTCSHIFLYAFRLLNTKNKRWEKKNDSLFNCLFLLLSVLWSLLSCSLLFCVQPSFFVLFCFLFSFSFHFGMLVSYAPLGCYLFLLLWSFLSFSLFSL